MAYAGNALPLDRRSYPHLTANPRAAYLPVTFDGPGTYAVDVAYRNPAGESIYATNTPLELTFIPEQLFESRRGAHLLLAGGLIGGLILLLFYHLARAFPDRARLDTDFALLLVAMVAFTSFDHGVLSAIFPRQIVPSYLVYAIAGASTATLLLFARTAFREGGRRGHRLRYFRFAAAALVATGGLCTLAYLLPDLGVPAPAWLTAGAPAALRIVFTVTLTWFVYSVVREVRSAADWSLYAIAIGLSSLALLIVVNVTQAVIEPYGDVALIGFYLAAIEPVFDYLISAGIVIMSLSFAIAVAQLRHLRIQSRERGFLLRLAEQEQRALRAQMNPHFLFNSLNSIKGYVIGNEPAIAADYLSKFAKLIRNVLDASSSSLVPLTKEFETIRLYLALERQRADGSFDYRVDLHEEVTTAGLRIPPALLQPFVENAVWHGVRALETRRGHISVLAERRRDGSVVVTIADNGVGRAAARSRSAHGRGHHRSRGLEITAERIALLRELHGIRVEITTEDIVGDGGAIAGTAVRLVIVAMATPIPRGGIHVEIRH